MEIIFLTLILLAALTLFITAWLPIEITALLLLPALYFSGVLDLSGVLSGFSSSATVTIGAMYILSAGLQRTGVLENITLALSRRSGDSPTRFILLLALVVPPASAFMNNTPVVVMMVPVVLAVARQSNSKPSRFMIPLSYLAILGGSCTLIGTSTNILVNDVYRKEVGGVGGFGMFEFAPLGLVFVIAGGLFIVFFGRKLLPDRSSLSAMLTRGRTAKFVTEITIESGTNLDAKKVSEIFGKGEKIRLLEVVRDETVILAPHALDIRLKPEDSLIIEGTSRDIAQFLTQSRASLSTVIEDSQRVPMRSMELSMGEAVILPKSPFSGRTVSDLGLNRQYGVKVLAVQRRGRHHRYKIRNMYLQTGDVLLLQGTDEGFNNLRQTEAVMIMEGLEKAIFYHGRAFRAISIMVVVIAMAALTDFPIAILALFGAVLMILTKCLRMDEAFRSLDPSVLLLLAGTIPLGQAMSETGFASLLVEKTMHILGGEYPLLKLAIIYAMTNILSQVLSNNATAVLMTPIAMSIATSMNVDMKPFLIAVAFGASASFMSPIGYQTNTIVMGPGGYSFRDYLRIGVPLTILTLILATFLIPVIWPF
ncbi:MAG: SLC13 family permease [Candidatus Sumerlaeia bacterium]